MDTFKNFVLLVALLCYTTIQPSLVFATESLDTIKKPDQPFHIIIPARFASERLPGKMLADIKGKPLIQRVYERAQLTQATSVTIATDHQDIYEAAKSFGANIIMTSNTHPTGSDRLAEAVTTLKLKEDDIVVNIQGDEPLIEPETVWLVVQSLINHPGATVATLSAPMLNKQALYNPNIVKIVTDQNNYAQYFSRAPIPFPRDQKEIELSDFKRHVGIYTYRVSALLAYKAHPPIMQEKYEKLEQLRFLWLGHKIHVSMIPEAPIDVNTQEDLEHVRKLF